MNRSLVIRYCAVFTLLWGLGCGDENGAGTGVSNPPSISDIPSSQMASSAVGAAFSEQGDLSLNKSRRLTLALLDLFIKEAIAVQSCLNDPHCLCERALRGEIDSHGVEVVGFKPAGIYGSANRSITIKENEFCSLPDGTLNFSNGPDGKGRLAGFAFTRDVVGSCSSGGLESEIKIRQGSGGAMRFTQASGGEAAHEPEIYGRFSFVFGESASALNCTLFIGADHKILLTDCEADGITIEQSLQASCQF